MSQVEQSDAGVRVLWEQEGEIFSFDFHGDLITLLYSILKPICTNLSKTLKTPQDSIISQEDCLEVSAFVFNCLEFPFCLSKVSPRYQDAWKLMILFEKGESEFPTEWLRDRRLNTTQGKNLAR